MAKKRTEVADIDRTIYDITDSEEGFEKLDAGLTPEIVEEISRRKDEPQWMLDFRLKSLETYHRMPNPTWGPSIAGLDMDNIVTYVTPDDEFSETQTFPYELETGDRTGFAVRITVPQEYTVTGIVSIDGEVQDTFSSPVYRLEYAEDGTVSLVADPALYLFADQEGRFIISGAAPGEYVFDVEWQGRWYAVHFEVWELEGDEIRVLDYGTIDFSADNADIVTYSYDIEGARLDEDIPAWALDYSGHLELSPVRMTDSATFWSELFPPMSAEEIAADFSIQ